MTEDSSKLMSDTKLQIQEAQGTKQNNTKNTPPKENKQVNKTTLRHLIFKLHKIKHEQILKEAKIKPPNTNTLPVEE